MEKRTVFCPEEEEVRSAPAQAKAEVVVLDVGIDPSEDGGWFAQIMQGGRQIALYEEGSRDGRVLDIEEGKPELVSLLKEARRLLHLLPWGTTVPLYSLPS